MVSGAGRRLTCRSVAAWLARCVTVRGSRRYAAVRAAAMMRRSPAPSNVPASGGELLVDGGAFLGGEARGFADEEGGAPFVELPGLQRGEGVRHLGDQGLRQAEQPAALGGGFAPGEGDLRADPGPELGRGHPGVGLFAALEQVKGDGQIRACGRPRRTFRSSRARSWPISPALSPAGRTAASARATSVTVSPAG